MAMQKPISFAEDYGDNDTGAVKENFIGSVFVSREDKNQG
jgi:hypothetical protein